MRASSTVSSGTLAGRDAALIARKEPASRCCARRIHAPPPRSHGSARCVLVGRCSPQYVPPPQQYDAQTGQPVPQDEDMLQDHFEEVAPRHALRACCVLSAQAQALVLPASGQPGHAPLAGHAVTPAEFEHASACACALEAFVSVRS